VGEQQPVEAVSLPRNIGSNLVEITTKRLHWCSLLCTDVESADVSLVASRRTANAPP
jgi:hypothetical protein